MQDPDRRAALIAAEARATQLFDLVEKRRLIAPGRRESEVQEDIYRLEIGRAHV